MIQVNEDYLGFRGEMIHARRLQSAGSENEKPARQIVLQKKNRFHYSLYCLVGFVLVSIKDVMKLLDDNHWETKSATTALETRAISAL